MAGQFARYEIETPQGMRTARLFMRESDEEGMSEFEVEVRSMVRDGFDAGPKDGSIGYTVDPYKAAEEILAKHYGSAEMIEAHYDWRPGVMN